MLTYIHLPLPRIPNVRRIFGENSSKIWGGGGILGKKASEYSHVASGYPKNVAHTIYRAVSFVATILLSYIGCLSVFS